jgi:acetamidase/formamidase
LGIDSLLAVDLDDLITELPTDSCGLGEPVGSVGSPWDVPSEVYIEEPVHFASEASGRRFGPPLLGQTHLGILGTQSRPPVMAFRSADAEDGESCQTSEHADDRAEPAPSRHQDGQLDDSEREQGGASTG